MQKKRETERERKEEIKVEFRSNILGDLWGQEVLSLLEQGPVLFAISN